MFTVICGECDEFDVLNITNCTNLIILNVGMSGLLRHMEALKKMRVFNVVGAVDRPISDLDLLNMVQSNGWSIVLHPTTNTFQEVLSCRIPGAYRELTLDAAVFAAATNEEIFKLRGLAFNYINSHRADYFWKKIIDDGVFHDDRKGDLKVKDLR